MTRLLEVEGLTVSSVAHDQPLLDNVSLHVDEGEVLALVGESGSGKSLTALSVMQLLPPNLRSTASSMRLGELDLMRLSRRELNHLHGGEVGMLFQQPRRMLDPTARVGGQVAEPLRTHLGVRRRKARREVLDLLGDVEIDDPKRRAAAYPHQLSGGLAQRVMVATALAASPRLLVADEPTTALDVTVEAQILKLIKTKTADLGMSVLFISHDLGVVGSIADRIAVMYAGRIVEVGAAADILASPEHPDTQALIQCSTLESDTEGDLFVIPGHGDSARDIEQGCRFRPRCPSCSVLQLDAVCAGAEPALEAAGDGEHHSRCWVGRETVDLGMPS